jgi:hypothetical protein
MGATLIHADRRTDMMKSIGAFRDYTNAPKNAQCMYFNGSALAYRTDNSGSVWERCICRLQWYERCTIAGILTHASRLFNNRERSCDICCVSVPQQNNGSIFARFWSDVSRQALILFGLIVQTSIHPTEETPVPRPKQTPFDFLQHIRTLAYDKPKSNVFHVQFHF